MCTQEDAQRLIDFILYHKLGTPTSAEARSATSRLKHWMTAETLAYHLNNVSPAIVVREFNRVFGDRLSLVDDKYVLDKYDVRSENTTLGADFVESIMKLSRTSDYLLERKLSVFNTMWNEHLKKKSIAKIKPESEARPETKVEPISDGKSAYRLADENIAALRARGINFF